MKTLWLMYKTEAKLSIREFSSVLFGVLVPAGLIILLGVLYGDGTLAGAQAVRQIDVSFGAVCTLGISSAGLMGIPITLSDYRWRKILKRYKVTPISPITLLLSHVFFCFSLSIVSTVLVYILSAALFGFAFKGSLAAFIGVYLLVMISIHAIGMVVASLSPNAQMAGVLASVIYFPMIFLSGATIPYEIMPKTLQTVADFMPLTQGIKLLKTVSLGLPLTDALFSFVVMVVTAVVGIVVSVRFFRWE
ncbi:ABC transporter permease [Oscillospiraceae bacterium MB08-C2-2]|nr:ABC transporter permease [Oscillospiraceae bacterium MB08-C2-2]